MRYLMLSITILSVVGCSHIPPAAVPSPSQGNAAAIVSDVDGTLTPAVLSVFEVRPDAAKALNTLADKGYEIVYVTTRIPLFQSGLHGWLEKNGFPDGSVHVAQTSEERAHPETFKARVLEDYVKRGWRLEYAFGDSSTDFAAYADAGIPKERVFALKRSGHQDCQQGTYGACLDGWTEYLRSIAE